MVALDSNSNQAPASTFLVEEVDRPSLLATTHVKIARRREAAWELYRLGKGSVHKPEQQEPDLETALVLAAAREREAGRVPCEVFVRALDEHPRTLSERIARWQQTFSRNFIQDAPDREKQEDEQRRTAAQLLVRLSQEGDEAARAAILRLLQEGCPQARLTLAETLPEEIDFETLEAVLRGVRRCWIAGSARAERTAWILAGVMICVSGAAAVFILAAEIFKIAEMSERSTWMILPGIIAIIGVAVHRSLHLTDDHKRQDRYFQRIASLTRRCLTHENEAKSHRLVPEFAALTNLMAIEGGQIAKEYRETLAHLRVAAAESLPLPSQATMPSPDSLPRPAVD